MVKIYNPPCQARTDSGLTMSIFVSDRRTSVEMGMIIITLCSVTNVHTT